MRKHLPPKFWREFCSDRYDVTSRESGPHYANIHLQLTLCNEGVGEDQIVLPSIETQTPDECDPSHMESRIHASSISESEEDSEVYEPQDTLPDHVDDDAVNIGPGPGTNHEQKRAHCTKPARLSRWNMHHGDRKPCDQSAPTQTEV